MTRWQGAGTVQAEQMFFSKIQFNLKRATKVEENLRNMCQRSTLWHGHSRGGILLCCTALLLNCTVVGPSSLAG